MFFVLISAGFKWVLSVNGYLPPIKPFSIAFHTIQVKNMLKYIRTIKTTKIILAKCAGVNHFFVKDIPKTSGKPHWLIHCRSLLIPKR